MSVKRDSGAAGKVVEMSGEGREATAKVVRMPTRGGEGAASTAQAPGWMAPPTEGGGGPGWFAAPVNGGGMGGAYLVMPAPWFQAPNAGQGWFAPPMAGPPQGRLPAKGETTRVEVEGACEHCGEDVHLEADLELPAQSPHTHAPLSPPMGWPGGWPGQPPQGWPAAGGPGPQPPAYGYPQQPAPQATPAQAPERPELEADNLGSIAAPDLGGADEEVTPVERNSAEAWFEASGAKEPPESVAAEPTQEEQLGVVKAAAESSERSENEAASLSRWQKLSRTSFAATAGIAAGFLLMTRLPPYFRSNAEATPSLSAAGDSAPAPVLSQEAPKRFTPYKAPDPEPGPEYGSEYGTSSEPALASFFQHSGGESEAAAQIAQAATVAPPALAAVANRPAARAHRKLAHRRRGIKVRPRSAGKGASPKLTKVMNQGERFYAHEQYRAALKRYQRALRLDPKNINARFSLALSSLQLGKLKGSKRQIELVLERAPDHAEAHLVLGFILQMKHLPSQAAEQYDRYLKLAPKGEWAAELKALLPTLGSGV